MFMVSWVIIITCCWKPPRAIFLKSCVILTGRTQHMLTPSDIRALSSKPTITKMVKEVESAFNQQLAQVKNVSLYLCHRHTASSFGQIGRYFNILESAVSQASRRFGMKIKRDKKLSKMIQRVEYRLNLSKV